MRSRIAGGVAGAVGMMGIAVPFALAASVPTCVTARYSNPWGPYQDVYVTNGCPATVRVKVIWANATDSRCYSIAPKATIKDHHFNQNVTDRWDGLQAC